MKIVTRPLSAAVLACLGTSIGQTAHAQKLDDNETQFVRFMWNAELEKANLYIAQGLVRPSALSSGKPLPYYMYGPGTPGYSSCRGPSFSQASDGECTPDISTTEYLLSGKFDLNKPVSGKFRPLSYVCWGRSLGVLTTERLIKAGVDVEFYDDNGFTPLHYCVWRNIGSTPRKGDYSEKTQRLFSIVGMMLAAGADVNAPLKLERTLGSTSDTPVYSGATPVMLAVSTWWGDSDGTKMIEQLFDKGADPNAKDEMGAGVVNYVSYPSRSRHYEPTITLLKLLHSRGVDILQPHPKSGKNLMTVAMEKGDVDFALEIQSIAKS